MATVSSREFNQDTGKVKKAALEGPVYITDRGKPSHVLLSFEAYQALTSKNQTIGELLSMDGAEEVEFMPAVLSDKATAAEY